MVAMRRTFSVLVWMAGCYMNDWEADSFSVPSIRYIRTYHHNPRGIDYFGFGKKLLLVQRWSNENNNGGMESDKPLDVIDNDGLQNQNTKKKAVKYVLNSNSFTDTGTNSINENPTSIESNHEDSDKVEGASYWNFDYHIDFKNQKRNSTSISTISNSSTLSNEQEKQIPELKYPSMKNNSSNNNKTVKYSLGMGKHEPIPNVKEDRRKIVTQDDEGRFLTGALWMYSKNHKNSDMNNNDPDESVVDDILAQNEVDHDISDNSQNNMNHNNENNGTVEKAEGNIKEKKTKKNKNVIQYEHIDLSIPNEVYDSSKGIDLVWDLLKYEAKREAAREPLLVSFLYSNIINHSTLESALAFYLANRLTSPAMISTQIMSLIQEALDHDPYFRRALRADIMAVRDRDPACSSLTDVFMYFKGFHALTTHRVAHYLWRQNRHVLAHFLQSRVSTTFQIDIHPNATMGTGIMLDHGTGIVIGETAIVGNNCSILHHVTLGGSGKKGVDRHPKVGNGVLLGAGCSVLGNINIGDGCQVGAGTLVITDLPAHSVAVGVPARIIGTFLDSQAQPSTTMNQLGTKESNDAMTLFTYESEGI